MLILTQFLACGQRSRDSTHRRPHNHDPARHHLSFVAFIHSALLFRTIIMTE